MIDAFSDGINMLTESLEFCGWLVASWLKEFCDMATDDPKCRINLNMLGRVISSRLSTWIWFDKGV